MWSDRKVWAGLVDKPEVTSEGGIAIGKRGDGYGVEGEILAKVRFYAVEVIAQGRLHLPLGGELRSVGAVQGPGAPSGFGVAGRGGHLHVAEQVGGYAFGVNGIDYPFDSVVEEVV